MLTEQAMADATYQRHLRGLQGWVGWFALIRGDALGGVFPTHEAATAAWMGLYGPVPALIRRIERTSVEAVATNVGPRVEGATTGLGIEVVTPAHADPMMAVVCRWAFPGGRGPAPRDYAA